MSNNLSSNPLSNNQAKTQPKTNPQTTNLTGLSDGQVLQKNQIGQINDFEIPKRSYREIFVDNAINSINVIIFCISIILVILGKYSDAGIYVSVILVNIAVGFYQEIRAKIQLEKISNLVSPTSVVIRNSQEITIKSSQIVLGETIKITLGDSIAVDGTILTGQVQVNESLLTGEGDLLIKKVNDQVFSGSFVVGGSAYIVATEVGQNSTANKLLAKSKTHKKILTPVQLQINTVVKYLFVIVAVLSSLVAIGNIFNGLPFEQSVQSTGVIIAIVPSSLFVMINLAYAVGSIKMGKKNVLVQKLNAVESISNVDVLCFDKTGTLTTNEIYLDKEIFVDEINDEKSQNQVKQDIQTFVNLCTSSNKTFEALEQKYPKNALENSPNNNPTLISEIGFGSSHKWSGVSFDRPKNNQEELENSAKNNVQSNTRTLIMGAFDVLNHQFKFDSIDASISQTIGQTVAKYIDLGCRVLCLVSSNENLVEGNATPLLPQIAKLEAILIFKDQLRVGVGEVLSHFYSEGVSIKIISGDNPEAVQSLFKQVVSGTDLAQMPTKFVSGMELAKMDTGEFELAVMESTIFGRITPEQKEYIVSVLRKNGKFVAMTGDGVNDILSLKKANLGIAMNSGSQATKQIADLVLLDDNLSSLLLVLQEGKRIKVSLHNIFRLYLSRGLFMLLVIIYCGIISLPFPLNIKQSSMLAIVATGLPSIAMTMWSTSQGYNKDHLGKAIVNFIVPAGFSMSIVGTALYLLLTVFKVKYGFGALSAQTGIFLFGTLCCMILSNIILVDKKMRILSATLGLGSIVIILTAFGSLWSLKTDRLLPIVISIIFVFIWFPMFYLARKFNHKA